MKTTRLFLIILLLNFTLLLSNAPAQEYTRWSLPDGAVARFVISIHTIQPFR